MVNSILHVVTMDYMSIYTVTYSSSSANPFSLVVSMSSQWKVVRRMEWSAHCPREGKYRSVGCKLIYTPPTNFVHTPNQNFYCNVFSRVATISLHQSSLWHLVSGYYMLKGIRCLFELIQCQFYIILQILLISPKMRRSRSHLKGIGSRYKRLIGSWPVWSPTHWLKTGAPEVCAACEKKWRNESVFELEQA